MPPSSQLEKAVKAAAGPAQSYIEEGTAGLGGKVKGTQAKFIALIQSLRVRGQVRKERRVLRHLRDLPWDATHLSPQSQCPWLPEGG